MITWLLGQPSTKGTHHAARPWLLCHLGKAPLASIVRAISLMHNLPSMGASAFVSQDPAKPWTSVAWPLAIHLFISSEESKRSVQWVPSFSCCSLLSGITSPVSLSNKQILQNFITDRRFDFKGSYKDPQIPFLEGMVLEHSRRQGNIDRRTAHWR